MDILDIFDGLFSSLSTRLKMNNPEEPSVNDKVHDIINKSPNTNKADEIKKRKLELAESRKENKVEKEFSKDR